MNVLKKKALYQAQHRGTKEADCMIGGFVNFYVHTIQDSFADLTALCLWLDQSDQTIFDWLSNAEPCPEFYHGLMSAFRLWLQSFGTK